MKDNKWPTAGAIAVIIAFTLSVRWINRTTADMIKRLSAISLPFPMHYIWWGLGIAAILALLVWLLWSLTRRGYVGGAMRSGWLWWPVVILLVVAAGIGIYWYLRAPYTITVGRDWSEPIPVPLGQNLRWQRTTLVAFEVRTDTGETHQFPRDLPERIHIPKGRSVSFRVTDGSVDTVVLELHFSPMRQNR
jgi:hypothetical protein